MKSFFFLAALVCLVSIPGSAFADVPMAAVPRPVLRAEPPAAVEDAPLVEASGVRKNIGISLTAVGIVNMTVGAGVMIGFSATGTAFGAIGGLIFGAPIHVEGTALMGVGVPLWVTGGELVPRRAAVPAPPHAPAVPEVSVGPGTGTVKWSF